MRHRFMRRRSGFTLVELMTVLAINGLMAAIAITPLSASKDNVYYAAMQSDLRALAANQEAFNAKNARYGAAADTASLNLPKSNGVTVTITTGTTQSWSASATHASLAATQSCVLGVGAGQTGKLSCI